MASAIVKWQLPTDVWLTPLNSDGTATSGVTTGTTRISQWMPLADTWLTPLNSGGTATSGVTTGTTLIAMWNTNTDKWNKVLLRYIKAKVMFSDAIGQFRIDPNGMLSAVSTIDEGNKGYDLPNLSYNDLNTRSNVKATIKDPNAITAAGQGYGVVLNYDTDFTDKTGRQWTTVGTGAKIVPGAGMFGSPALQLDGASHVETPITDDLKMIGNGDFTIRWYEKRTVAGTYSTAMSFDATETSFAGPGDYDFVIGMASGNNVICYAWAPGPTIVLNAFNLGTFDIGVGAVYELGRKDNTFYGFKNGVLISKQDSSLPIDFSGITKFIIGNRASYVEGHFSGIIDEVIVRPGVCEHTSDYPLPTGPVTLTPTVPVRMTQTAIVQSTGTTLFDLSNRTGIVSVGAVGTNTKLLFSFDGGQTYVGQNKSTQALEPTPVAAIWAGGIPVETVGKISAAEWSKVFQRGPLSYVAALGSGGSLTSMEVNVPAQSAPLLSNMVISASTTHLNNVDITGTVSDPDGDLVQYRVLLNDKVIKLADPFTSGPLAIQVSIDPHEMKVAPLTNQVVVEAKDSAGLTTTKTYVVTVVNAKPVAVTSIDQMLGFNASISDSDSDIVSYRLALKKVSQGDEDYKVVLEGKDQPVPLSISWVPPLNSLDIGEDYIYRLELTDTLETVTVTSQFKAIQRGLVLRDKVTNQPLNDEAGNIISSVFLGSLYAGGASPSPVPIVIENLTGTDVKDLTLAIRDTSSDKFSVMVSDTPNFNTQLPILQLPGYVLSLGAKVDCYMLATTQNDITIGTKQFYIDVGVNKV